MSFVRAVVVLILLLPTLSRAAEAAEPEPAEVEAPLDGSVTIEPLFLATFSLLFNSPGTVAELQYAPFEKVSLLLEGGYFVSDDFRKQDGTDTGLRTRWLLVNAGFVYWLGRQRMRGPFASFRGELWFVRAENASGTVAAGNQVDVNLQVGWTFVLGKGLTLGPGVTFGYATGPVRSEDETVEFPVSGFAVAPHLRLGWSW